MQFNTHHPPKLRDKVLFTPSSQQHSPNCSGLSASLRCARTSRIHRVLNPQPTGLKRSLTNSPDHTSRDTLGGPVSRLRGVRASCDPQWLLHGIRLVPGSPTNARSHWEFGGRVEASIGRVRASLIYGGPTSHPTGPKGSIPTPRDTPRGPVSMSCRLSTASTICPQPIRYVLGCPTDALSDLSEAGSTPTRINSEYSQENI